MVKTSLPPPDDSAGRKAYPVMTGCLNYAPAALAGVARWSKLGNDKHNPGQELHHARGKSMDHGDCIVRHLMDIQDALAYHARGFLPALPGGVQQLIDDADALAWRALMLSQELHERFAGAPLAPGARLPVPPVAELHGVPVHLLSQPFRDGLGSYTRQATEAEVVMRGAECGHQQGSYAQERVNAGIQMDAQRAFAAERRQTDVRNVQAKEEERVRAIRMHDQNSVKEASRLEAERVRAMRGRLEGENPTTAELIRRYPSQAACEEVRADQHQQETFGSLEAGDNAFLDGTGG